MTLRISPLALGGLLALVGLNAWILTIMAAEQAPEPEPAVAAIERVPKLLQLDAQAHLPRPVGAYAETLARPVFFKSRQPYVPPPPTSKPVLKLAPPAPVDPGLVLGGVMITDLASKAYIFDKADSRGSWLGQGDAIGGWKVEFIGPVSAKLQQAGRTIELQLYPKH